MVMLQLHYYRNRAVLCVRMGWGPCGCNNQRCGVDTRAPGHYIVETGHRLPQPPQVQVRRHCDRSAPIDATPDASSGCCMIEGPFATYGSQIAQMHSRTRSNDQTLGGYEGWLHACCNHSPYRPGSPFAGWDHTFRPSPLTVDRQNAARLELHIYGRAPKLRSETSPAVPRNCLDG